MEPGEYDTIARLEDHHWWYTGMRAVASGLLRRALGPPPAQRQILDAGCGTGGGLRWLAGFGTVTGIDYHPLALRYAARVSTQVSQASVQALPFSTNSFDLVTSFEVLYHLAVTDDVQALCEFARVLRPGGWLLVRVPAYDWLRGAHDRQVHTRHRYTRGELRRKLATAGLRVRRLTHVGLALLPPAILRRLVQRNSHAESDVTLPPPIVNRCLATVLRAEGAWLRCWDLPAGLSVLALAQKPVAGG